MDIKPPYQPLFAPEDNSEEKLRAWTREWSRYRDEVVAQLASLLEHYDNARELVAALQVYFSQVENGIEQPRPWKTAVVSKDPGEFYVRRFDGSLERELVKRQPEGWWAIIIEGGDPIEASDKVARRLLAAATWWGDLTAIYNAKAWRGEGGCFED